jgi:hypothetical protein
LAILIYNTFPLICKRKKYAWLAVNMRDEGKLSFKTWEVCYQKTKVDRCYLYTADCLPWQVSLTGASESGAGLFAPYGGGGETTLRAFYQPHGRFMRLSLCFRMQEYRPPSPQDVGMILLSMGSGILPHLP